MAQGGTLAIEVARTRPLGEFRAQDLADLLEAESRHWERELLWDYADVSAAVARGLDGRSLAGRALLRGDRPVGYCYYLQDADRAIVGSLFTLPVERGLGFEEELLMAVLRDSRGRRENRRVECQTLFCTSPGVDASFARAGFVGAERHYLVCPLDTPPPGAGRPARLRHVRRSDLDELARIVHESHRDSVDAALNTTYSTRRHCRHFVETLVLRSGCGRFDPEASFVAERDERPVGVVLSSQLSRSNGHVCQASVLPAHQGHGVGEALLRAALDAFRRQGLAVASLSVTVENRNAYRLYERLGFRVRRRFGAHAWARPPERVVLPA